VGSSVGYAVKASGQVLGSVCGYNSAEIEKAAAAA